MGLGWNGEIEHKKTQGKTKNRKQEEEKKPGEPRGTPHRTWRKRSCLNSPLLGSCTTLRKLYMFSWQVQPPPAIRRQDKNGMPQDKKSERWSRGQSAKAKGQGHPTKDGCSSALCHDTEEGWAIAAGHWQTLQGGSCHLRPSQLVICWQILTLRRSRRNFQGTFATIETHHLLELHSTAIDNESTAHPPAEQMFQADVSRIRSHARPKTAAVL